MSGEGGKTPENLTDGEPIAPAKKAVDLRAFMAPQTDEERAQWRTRESEEETTKPLKKSKGVTDKAAHVVARLFLGPEGYQTWMKDHGFQPIFGVTKSEPSTSTPNATEPPHHPALGAASRLDEASRVAGFRGDGSPRMAPPTAEGLARTQEAAPSTPTTPPAGPTTGK